MAMNQILKRRFVTQMFGEIKSLRHNDITLFPSRSASAVHEKAILLMYRLMRDINERS